MSAATLIPQGPSEPPPRKRFTRAEFENMIEAGIFAGQRCELIDGDLIDKMGQKPAHAFVIRLVQALLSGIFGSERIQVQLPIEVNQTDLQWSLPEPDLAVLLKANAEFQTRYPRADELLLLIEVADTTVRHDLTTKRDLYARAGVSDYWVLDLRRRALVVHRDPRQGSYQTIAVFSETDSASLGDGKVKIAVAQMLPDRNIT